MGLFVRPEPAPVTASAHPLGVGGPHRAQALGYNTQRAMTAAAERIVLDPSKPDMLRARPYSEWQAQAWEGYDRVGEVHNGFGVLANLLTRIRLYPGVVDNADEAPVNMSGAQSRGLVDERTAGLCKQLMDNLLESSVDLIRSFTLNTSVAGECYLIHLPRADGTKSWIIVSTDEVRPGAVGGYQLRQIRNGQEIVNLSPDTYIARIWRKHPRYSKEPDSSLLGVREPMQTLLMIDRWTRTIIRSRLNAGVLFIPDTVTSNLSTAETAEPVIEEPGTLDELRNSASADPSSAMLADLIQLMSAPISDETNAASLVPMVLQGPQDAGEKIKHILLSRDFDEWLSKQGDIALDRVLNGLDVPKEIITGLNQVKYSNAIIIDEGMYKASIEPLALMLADALTTVYLKPHLLANQVDPTLVQKLVVWYDPTDIVTRPNSAEDATEGFDRGLLSGSAWRREHGFAASDEPDEDELALMLLTRSAVIPESILLAAARKVLGDDIEITPSSNPNGGVANNHGPVNLSALRPTGEQDRQRRAVQQVGVK